MTALLRIDTLQGTDALAAIPSLIAFSNAEFAPYAVLAPAQAATSDPTHWQTLVTEKAGTIHRCHLNDILSGLIFTYANPSGTHIWLAVTAVHARRKGVMRALFASVLARESVGFIVTVNTLPEVFVDMPPFLESQGFHLQAEESVTDGIRSTRKLRFQKVV
ncbi:hypothetical protein BC830DRAFT_1147832 [Chytriomyces sp. MP71]|nr:hypothetical protein BC830DRAFT_1147832 [Chytriomyces sp. MP71]